MYTYALAAMLVNFPLMCTQSLLCFRSVSVPAMFFFISMRFGGLFCTSGIAVDPRAKRTTKNTHNRLDLFSAAAVRTCNATLCQSTKQPNVQMQRMNYKALASTQKSNAKILFYHPVGVS